MPLDVQPLSRIRRLWMLAVLLAFFGASLGFAEFLVIRRSAHSPVVVSLDSFGFTNAKPISLHDEVEARGGMVNGQPRTVRVFILDLPANLSFQDQAAIAADLFGEITGAAPTETIPDAFAGHPAARSFGIADNGRFTILRLAAVGTYGIGISYSGPGPYTDADKTALDAICEKGIHLRI